jgi:hypothetical protein
MISSLNSLIGQKNKDRIVVVLSDLIDRGLVAEIQSQYGRSSDASRKLYYVTSCESLVGGMSVQDPPTRSLDHYRKILLALKQSDTPFSVRDIESMGQAIGVEGGCSNEIQRLMRSGFLMYNNDIRKYEFLK